MTLQPTHGAKKANLPDTGRKNATCFVINNKAYVVGGGINYSGHKSAHVWEYDPANDQWTAKKDYPTGVEYAQSFTINNTGFVTGGYNNGAFIKSIYQYDPAKNDWIKKADQCGDGRSAGVAFVLGNTAFVGLGVSRPVASGPEVFKKDFCQYDAASDTWTPAGYLPAPARAYGIACVANGKAYVGAGFFYDGAQNYLKDWQSFGFPTDVHTLKPADFAIYPNPADRFITASTDINGATVRLYDITGRIVLSAKVEANNTIDVSGVAPGPYIINVTAKNKSFKTHIAIRH